MIYAVSYSKRRHTVTIAMINDGVLHTPCRAGSLINYSGGKKKHLLRD